MTTTTKVKKALDTPRKIRAERSEAIKCLAEASLNYDAALSEFKKGRLTEAEFVQYDLALATEINNLCYLDQEKWSLTEPQHFDSQSILSHYVPGWWKEEAKREARGAKAKAQADLVLRSSADSGAHH